MRIAVTSDLHADVTPANRELMPYLVQVCQEATVDVLLICGDVSPHLEELGQVLVAFDEGLPGCRKLFVAGNHDIWVQEASPDLSSTWKYEKITRLCAQHGFHHLGDAPLVIKLGSVAPSAGTITPSSGRVTAYLRSNMPRNTTRVCCGTTSFTPIGGKVTLR